MLRAAKEWGILPSTIGLCEAEENLTWMVAYIRTETEMQAVEQQEQEREMRRRSNAANRP